MKLSSGLMKGPTVKVWIFWMSLIELFVVKAYPLASPEIEPEIRRCLFARFPYSLVYGIDDETIVVIAVAHSHRQPRYWIDRRAE